MFNFKDSRGGTRPDKHKERSYKAATEEAAVPDILIFPLSQHIGAPAKAIVEPGDRVLMGQIIGEAQGAVSAHVHSSVSGEVIAVENRATTKGLAPCIVVRNDHRDERAPLPTDWKEASELDSDGIRERIRAAGIAGMGGATFPAAIKVSPPPTARIDTLIINGAECEPYVTADLRLLAEDYEELLEGISVLQSLFPALNRTVVAVEYESLPYIAPLMAAIEEREDLELKVFPDLYPQGAEKKLIQNVSGREVPPGGLPSDVHCLIHNVATVSAMGRAVRTGEPLIRRIVTVNGSGVKKPLNLRVRIGTPISALLEYAGINPDEAGRVLSGGPMMGIGLRDLDTPVTKGTNGITVLAPENIRAKKQTPCINCGECVNVCPVSLQPILIADLTRRGRTEDAREMGALDCIECGACSYICPAGIPLLAIIRDARGDLRRLDQAKAEKAKKES